MAFICNKAFVVSSA